MSRMKPAKANGLAKSMNQAVARPVSAGSGIPWLRLTLLLVCGAAVGWMVSLGQSTWNHSPTKPADASENAPILTGSPKKSDDKDVEAPDAKTAAPPGVVARINDSPAPMPAPAGMVWVPGGVFWRGSDSKGHRDSLPWHLAEVDGFWMDPSPVTNERFERFIKAAGYVTVAERTPLAKDFPGAPAENLVAGSVVFAPPKGAVPLDNHYRWWAYVKGASWRHPEGPTTDLKGREKHPVVQIAFEDAQAYCKWAGKRLPTEAEFEFAARGGLDRHRYPWGNELQPGGKWMANIWQGRFPHENTMEDGYRTTSPVGAFPPNRFGLNDMSGNVWQWCADWYRHDYYRSLAGQPQPVRNPAGPNDSLDPAEPPVAKRVMRGGSYLCTDQYCTAYEVGARGKGAPDTGTSHLGFRCVKSAR